MHTKWLSTSLLAMQLLAVGQLPGRVITVFEAIQFLKSPEADPCREEFNQFLTTFRARAVGAECREIFHNWVAAQPPIAFSLISNTPAFEVIQTPTAADFITLPDNETISASRYTTIYNTAVKLGSGTGTVVYTLDRAQEIWTEPFTEPPTGTHNITFLGNRGIALHTSDFDIGGDLTIANARFITENFLAPPAGISPSPNDHASLSIRDMHILHSRYMILNEATLTSHIAGASLAARNINVDLGSGFDAINAGPVSGGAFGDFLHLNDFVDNGDVSFQSLAPVQGGKGIFASMDSLQVNAVPFGNKVRPFAVNTAPIDGGIGVHAQIAGTWHMESGVVELLNTGSNAKATDYGVLCECGDYQQTGGDLLLINMNSDVEGLGVVVSSASNADILAGRLILRQSTRNPGRTRVRFQAADTVTIGEDAFFGGTGEIAARRMVIQGRGHIGNSPGVLTLTIPEVVQESTSRLEFTVRDACNFSQIQASGTLELAGSAKIIADDWFCVDSCDTFPIILAEGISGQFNCVESCLPSGVFPILSYQPNAVCLSFLFKCPCLCEYMGNFTQTLFSSITDTNNFMIKRELQRVQERIVSTDANKKMGNFFIGPLGSVGRSEQHGSQVGFDFWSAGAVAGADYAFSQGGVGGLVLYENIQSDDEADCFGHFRTQRAHGSLYGAYIPAQDPQFSLDLMVGGGYDWYNIHRSIERGSARGNPNGYEVDGMLSLEYTFARNAWHVIPMVNLQYIYLHVDGYRERGFGFTNLSFESQKAKSLSTIVGASADNTWKWQYPLTAQVNLGWQREYLNHDRTLRYAGCQTLELDGASRNNLLAGADLWLQIKDGWGIEGSYELIWNNHFYRNGFYLGLNSTF